MRLFSPLVLFLFCLYLATSSGHTSSNDEDEMFYVTQSIVERHTLALPPDEAQALAIPRGAARAADGNYYSPYGPLQSVLAIPLYLVGRATALAFDPRFEGFITRAAVTVLPAVATAATAGLLTLLARDLGASNSGAVFLGLVYGTATIAWPYARSFWSEPLASLLVVAAALLAIRGSRQASAMHWLLATLCVGLAVATRSAMIVMFVPLGVYLVAGAYRCGRSMAMRRLVRQMIGFGAGLLLPAVVLGVYNVVRFGLAWEGGSGFGRNFGAASTVFGGDPITGLTGLLVSPGKSIFLYSPPLLAALLALPTFVRRVRWEAILVLGAVLAQIALVAPLVFWHGDAAWGPRYLVPVVPFLLLTLVAWLGPIDDRPRWAGRVLTLVVGLGILVQVLGAAVNFDTYVLVSGGPDGPAAQRRWFDLIASPLLAAPRQLADRLAGYGRSVGPGEYAFGTGFFEPEGSDGALPRWTDGHAAIAFRPATDAGGAISLLLTQPEPAGLRARPDLTVLVDGRPLADSAWHVLRAGSGQFQILVDLPPVLNGNVHRLELRSPVFIPARIEAGSTDTRGLGVRLQNVRIAFGNTALSIADVPVVPDLPVVPEQPWSRRAFAWFYDPTIPHLLDLWPWYVASSGLPQPLALTVVVVLAVLVIAAVRLQRRISAPSEYDWSRPACLLVGGVTLLAVVLSLSAATLAATPTSLRGRGGEQPPLLAAITRGAS